MRWPGPATNGGMSRRQCIPAVSSRGRTKTRCSGKPAVNTSVALGESCSRNPTATRAATVWSSSWPIFWTPCRCRGSGLPCPMSNTAESCSGRWPPSVGSPRGEVRTVAVTRWPHVQHRSRPALNPLAVREAPRLHRQRRQRERGFPESLLVRRCPQASHSRFPAH